MASGPEVVMIANSFSLDCSRGQKDSLRLRVRDVAAARSMGVRGGGGGVDVGGEADHPSPLHEAVLYSTAANVYMASSTVSAVKRLQSLYSRLVRESRRRVAALTKARRREA
eukprot:contig_42191_g9559